MAVAQLLVAALAGTTIASAIPAPMVGTTTSGRFTVNQARNPRFKQFSATVSLYKTMLKYGVKPSEQLEAKVAGITGGALGKRVTGSSVATPIDIWDDAYICPVQIGTPAQTLNLDFDTGSSDFWVFSSLTTASEVDGQSIYSPGSSTTSSLVSGASWSILYGDNSTSKGIVYTDTVTLGGLTVAKQQVEVAQQVSSSFTQNPYVDGLVGFGFDNINTVRPTAAKTFFTNVMGTLDSALFTVDLKHQAAGSYDFGFIDASKYTGSLTYTSVTTTNGWWQWTSSGYQIGSNSFTSTSVVGIADTGTTLLFLPTSLVRSYYATLSGTARDSEGLYYFRCALTPPSLTFGVGSARITIPSKLMNLGVGDDTGTYCVGGLQDASLIGINIFGDVALKAAFVVFDRSTTTPRLGWASKTT